MKTTFFRAKDGHIIALSNENTLTEQEKKALVWLFEGAEPLSQDSVEGIFVGPRREMVTPWSTEAVEITQNMNIKSIERIEEYFPVNSADAEHDPMLQRIYKGLDQNVFKTDRQSEPIRHITDFRAYNQEEGLALSEPEIGYLEGLSKKLGRPLTDSEVFGFSQVNSEHCRHKIFNGTFIIDGKERESTLFQLIKKTSKTNPGLIVSAYKDNCAFIEGPTLDLFHPEKADRPSSFVTEKVETVISLKAETHNFPTTVEPFNGAATGTGGEIRDRMAGGCGSFPIAGTAVYMTPYSRVGDVAENGASFKLWENLRAPRKWLYQTPAQLLIKASNGASDFGNKFGQPIICGSLLTFENGDQGFDKMIMMAGGVGYAKAKDAQKQTPGPNDTVVLLGGDNYRIGMGGGAVSSVNTGQYAGAIELNAVQRANPEMQKRVYNAIRGLAESDNNPIISVHDHGAGGHLNCLSELVEEQGGTIDISRLPIGDKTLSDKEIIGNESQERMGLVMKDEDASILEKIAERERAPFYRIGHTTGKHNFTLENSKTGNKPIDLHLSDMFGNAPKTIMTDKSAQQVYPEPQLPENIADQSVVASMLRLEAVACKDWLTNKVDRCVTGLIACQQCDGPLQLPLNDLGVTAVGYDSPEGIATSIGHAPVAALIDPAAGSRLAIAKALTGIALAPLKGGLGSVSLSANWMWPCRNEGEDARLYNAVQAASDFAIALGINIPTGKDSLSMTQKYPDGTTIKAPGTLIISTVAPVSDIYNVLHPTAKAIEGSELYLLRFDRGAESPLGGSSLYQSLGAIGAKCADISEPDYFRKCFAAVQAAHPYISAAHDISAGGLVTSILEMCFSNTEGGWKLDWSPLGGDAKALYCEQPGILMQVAPADKAAFLEAMKGVDAKLLGTYSPEREISIDGIGSERVSLDIDLLRNVWYQTSWELDRLQTGPEQARERFENLGALPLTYRFPKDWKATPVGAKTPVPAADAPLAAILREKGSNSDREMAWALYSSGFRVRDIHVTDLVSGREDLSDVRLLVYVGGFSNADTLGSAKGWAGALMYNERAAAAIKAFYAREDTMSLGICNGCQLMAELGLIEPTMSREANPKMRHNLCHKFECGFAGVTVPESPSIMLKPLTGCSLGIWCAHGEGRFDLGDTPLENLNIALQYSYDAFPANPNGSPKGIAGMCSKDGRHLAMMPHPERSMHSFNWAWWPGEASSRSPWHLMFESAYGWLSDNCSK